MLDTTRTRCTVTAALALAGALLAPSVIAAEASAPQPPRVLAFDPTAMDPQADACEDFYQYACGGWHQRSPRPANVSYWSRPWSDFKQQIDVYLRQVIEHSATQTETPQSADAQRVGNFYAACMDTAAIDARGLTALQQELALIDAMTSTRELAPVLGRLIRQSVPSSYRTGRDNGMVLDVSGGGGGDGWRSKVLSISSGQAQAPLNLPDRALYLDASADGVALREHYRDHVARMLQLAGQPAETARNDAAAVLALETALAQVLPTGEDFEGDLERFVNPRTPEQLRRQYPHFDWDEFLRALEAPAVAKVELDWLPFFERWDALAESTPLSGWQAYLRFHLITDRARFLPQAFRDESFAFFDQTVDGKSEALPRWRDCMNAVQRYLPDPLSRVFLEQGDRPQLNARVESMFEELRTVMRDRIEAATWLSTNSRRKTLDKLDAMRLAVSHPQQWRDDPRLVIRADDAYGNAQRAGTAQYRRSFDGLGQPLALDEWSLPPIWVGGFYSPTRNALYMTAAQLLFYAGDDGDDLAALYGGLGSFIGHELSHGFDPMGSQYDIEGRVRPWWTPRDRKRFEQRTDCVAETYSQLSYPNGDRLDGKRVVTEQTAELVAHQIALDAYHRATAGKAEADRHGLSAEQRFYVSAAQTICLDATPEVWSQLVNTDPHAFGPPGVQGTMLNMPDFAETFGCQPSQAMARPVEAMCRIW